MGAAPPDRWTPPPRRVLAITGLCAVTLLAYSNSFQAGFSLDSRGILLQDRIHAATAENLQLILEHTYWWPYGESGLYRPITTLTYLFNYAVLGNGDQPAGYHEINFLLHVSERSAGVRSGAAMVEDRLEGLCGGGSWAVHPVLTESVTNIAGRADLLAALAVLGGLWMYLKSAESRERAALGLVGRAHAGRHVRSILQRECRGAAGGDGALRTELVGSKRGRALALGCLAVLPALMAMAYQRAQCSRHSRRCRFRSSTIRWRAGFLERQTHRVRLLAKYLGLLIWPAHLSWDYSYAQIPMVTGSLADWAGWMARRRRGCGCVPGLAPQPHRLLAIGFAFATFLPTSNLVLSVGAIFRGALPLSAGHRVGYMPGSGGGRTGRTAPVVCA